MDIQDLLAQGKQIRGNQNPPLAQVIVRMGKIFGDICRRERNAPKDISVHEHEDLQKEL